MYKKIIESIEYFTADNLLAERKELLQPLVEYIQAKKDHNEIIRLSFICTHNSRRSHFSQVWAQTMAYHYDIKNFFCYSGGTEATAMYPYMAIVFAELGFIIQKLCDTANPVYAIKYSENENPVICFSKVYNDRYNPKSHFGAILNCHDSDSACPIIFGAEAKFPINYEDPKIYDNTPFQSIKYTERCLEIAQEMWWVFSQVK